MDVSNCITLRIHVVHSVEIFEMGYCRSWKSRGRSWLRNGKEVKPYLPKTIEMIYMPSIAG
jgi:hypothetical protein